MQIDPRNTDTWPTQAKLRRQLEIEASDADWNGDAARAAVLRSRLTALDPKLDHELVVPF
jgi:hypothetical protein